MKVLTLNLIEQYDPKCKEAINRIRSSIEFMDRDIKVIAFAGCTEAEGAWKIALNLAASYSNLGKKTLFMDANLRDRKLTKFYHADCGLTEYLQHKAELEEIIYQTNMDCLDVILPGSFPDNPSDLVAGAEFKQLLPQLRNDYDHIILNMPPFQGGIDGAVMGRLSDGVIPVLDQGKTKYKQVGDMKQTLERSGCEILGCIYNQLATPKKSFLRML